jgi:hypothetical protein
MSLVVPPYPPPRYTKDDPEVSAGFDAVTSHRITTRSA